MLKYICFATFRTLIARALTALRTSLKFVRYLPTIICFELRKSSRERSKCSKCWKKDLFKTFNALGKREATVVINYYFSLVKSIFTAFKTEKRKILFELLQIAEKLRKKPLKIRKAN